MPDDADRKEFIRDWTRAGAVLIAINMLGTLCINMALVGAMYFVLRHTGPIQTVNDFRPSVTVESERTAILKELERKQYESTMPADAKSAK